MDWGFIKSKVVNIELLCVHLLKLDFGYKPGWMVACTDEHAFARSGYGYIKQAPLTLQFVTQWVFQETLLGIINIYRSPFEVG
jgi:hypothetical protein